MMMMMRKILMELGVFEGQSEGNLKDFSRIFFLEIEIKLLRIFLDFFLL